MGDNLGVLKKMLSEPFPESRIKQREGAGRRMFDYIPAGDIIERLNNNTIFDWSVSSVLYTPSRSEERPAKGGNGTYTKVIPAYWTVVGTLNIHGLGVRSGIGTQIEETEDGPKGAETDALKRAAVKFGVALDLYIKDDEVERNFAQEFADRCERIGYKGKKNELCALLVGKEVGAIARGDYEYAIKKSAQEWQKAIDKLTVSQ